MHDWELAERYEKYGYLVYRRCLAIVGNRVDAEDAMQEVFIRAQRFRQRYDHETPLAWLYTIATHCCFDLLKKGRRSEVMAPDELAAFDRRQVGSADEGDVRAMVGAVLRSLDRLTGEIGVMHYLGGLTQDEIGEQTGYSRRTIGKKLRRFEEAFAATRHEEHER